jgi:hypothetical protein
MERLKGLIVSVLMASLWSCQQGNKPLAETAPAPSDQEVSPSALREELLEKGYQVFDYVE